jgi:hypothetical protein
VTLKMMNPIEENIGEMLLGIALEWARRFFG